MDAETLEDPRPVDPLFVKQFDSLWQNCVEAILTQTLERMDDSHVGRFPIGMQGSP